MDNIDQDLDALEIDFLGGREQREQNTRLNRL